MARCSFVHRGRLFRVGADGGAPESLAGGDGVSDLALSPDGTRLAFLRDGDLWLWPRDCRGLPRGSRRSACLASGACRSAPTTAPTSRWAPASGARTGGRSRGRPTASTIALHLVDRRHIRRCRSPRTSATRRSPASCAAVIPATRTSGASLHVLDARTRGAAADRRSMRRDAARSATSSGRRWVACSSIRCQTRAPNAGCPCWTPVRATPRLVWHDHRDTRIYPSYVARWHPDGRRILVRRRPRGARSTATRSILMPPPPAPMPVDA